MNGELIVITLFMIGIYFTGVGGKWIQNGNVSIATSALGIGMWRAGE